MKHHHLKTYKVYYSNHSCGIARAFTVQGARRQAWNATAYKYGWTKADFMKNSSVEIKG